MSNQHNGFDFVKGALIGGVLGSVAALLSAPKSGRELREDIADTYNNVNQKSHELASNIRDKKRQLTRYLINGEHEPEYRSGSALIQGGIAGVVVGAVAALLLARKPGKKLRQDISNKYEQIRHRAEDFVTEVGERGEEVMDRVEGWKDTLASLVDKATAKRKSGSNAVSDIAEWADLGLRLYHQLQNRR